MKDRFLLRITVMNQGADRKSGRASTTSRFRNQWSRWGLFAVLVLLQGCGGGGSNNGVPAPPALTGPEFLYVGTGSAGGPNELLIFPIDLNTGALGAPTMVPATGSIVATAGDPFGKVLYTSETGVGLHEYSINGSTGALTEFSGSPFNTPAGPILYTDTQNKFVYTPCPYVRSSSGTLTTSSPPPCSTTGAGGDRAAVDPGDVFVLSTCDNRGEAVCLYSLDPTTGFLTNIPQNNEVFANFYMPTDVVVHPSGNFAYSAGPFAAFAPPPLPPPEAFEEIAVFSVDRAAKQISIAAQMDLPFVIDNQVIAMDPAGQSLYVADSTKILAYSINGMDGSLTPIAGSPYLGQHTFSLAANVFHVDPAGKFLYLTALDSNAIFGYRIDSTTGAISPLAGSPFPIGVVPLTMSVVRTP